MNTLYVGVQTGQDCVGLSQTVCPNEPLIAPRLDSLDHRAGTAVMRMTLHERQPSWLTHVPQFTPALAIAASLLFYRYTFDHPEFRIPVMAATVFGGMFLSRLLVLGPLAFAIGFVLAITQSMADSVHHTDE